MKLQVGVRVSVKLQVVAILRVLVTLPECLCANVRVSVTLTGLFGDAQQCYPICNHSSNTVVVLFIVMSSYIIYGSPRFSVWLSMFFCHRRVFVCLSG